MRMRRFGLSRAQAEVVMEWFDHFKTPRDDKWSAAELAHKLDSAYEMIAKEGEFGLRLGG